MVESPKLFLGGKSRTTSTLSMTSVPHSCSNWIGKKIIVNNFCFHILARRTVVVPARKAFGKGGIDGAALLHGQGGASLCPGVSQS